MLRLTIWFKNPKNKQNLIVYRTNTCDFGDSQASLALRVAQDKYIAANARTKLGIIASSTPFADNYLFSGKSKEEVLGEPDDVKTNALGLTWDTSKDTLEPIFHYHLSDKAEEIIDNLVVTRTLLSQITPQSFDLTGVFLGPIKAALKILLSRACDITSLQEKDLDLTTRDASLGTDVSFHPKAS